MRNAALARILALVLAGCYGGELTDTLATLEDRGLSGVAGPPNHSALRPVEGVDRARFGTSNDADALTFPSLSGEARAFLFDANDPSSPLSFFVTPQAVLDGVGPLFNQNHCAGCHDSGADNAALAQSVALGAVLTATSPMTRAGRTAVSDHERVSPPEPAPTSAFTLFGDFYPGEDRFDPLERFGGPVRHFGATGGCFVDQLPAPNLAPGAVRQLGERAAPSYVGRGLIEAIYAPDIEALADPDDRISSLSTLTPPPACKGDCISGRVNENRADTAMAGGDPITRVGRFGLRAAATTLLELCAFGAQRHLGLTSPFLPTEEQNPFNTGLGCDLSPDPELSATELLDLRDMIRALAPPEPHPALLAAAATSDEDRDIQEGAALFGVDLDAFRMRLSADAGPVDFGDDDADRGIAVDRQLNCVGCHTPIAITGAAPSSVVAEQLSHRWVPLFSDLLVHDMGSFPANADAERLERSHPFFRGIPRNLADHALPNQGAATGAEWRTAPLLGFGLVGPPFLHDARVFLNPSAPAYFFFGSRTADEAGTPLAQRRVEVTDLDTAIRAAIELHDLPQPPDTDLDGVPDYDSCPELPAELDWCSRNSSFRSEARNSVEKWHALSDRRQAQVVAFLKAL